MEINQKYLDRVIIFDRHSNHEDIAIEKENNKNVNSNVDGNILHI